MAKNDSLSAMMNPLGRIIGKGTRAPYAPGKEPKKMEAWLPIMGGNPVSKTASKGTAKPAGKTIDQIISDAIAEKAGSMRFGAPPAKPAKGPVKTSGKTIDQIISEAIEEKIKSMGLGVPSVQPAKGPVSTNGSRTSSKTVDQVVSEAIASKTGDMGFGTFPAQTTKGPVGMEKTIPASFPAVGGMSKAPPTLPKLGFGGVSTFDQYYPETMSMTSKQVLETARKMRMQEGAEGGPVQKGEPGQATGAGYAPTPEEIASVKKTKYMPKEYAKYVISKNPGKKPNELVREMIAKGYVIEGLNDEGAEKPAEFQKPAAGTAPTAEGAPAGEVPTGEPGILSKIGTAAGESVVQSGKSLLGAVGTVAGAIPKVAGGVVDIGEELLGGGDGYGEKIKRFGEGIQEKSMDFAGVGQGMERDVLKTVADIGLPLGTAGKGIGMVAGKIPKIAKGAEIVSKLPGAGKAIKAATSPFAKGVGLGALGTASVPGADIGDITAGGVTGGVFTYTVPLLKGAKEVAIGLEGKITGVGAENIREAFKSAHTAAFQKAMRGEISPEEVLIEAKNALEVINGNKKIIYGRDYEAFKKASERVGNVDTTDLLTALDKKLADFGLKAKLVETKKGIVAKLFGVDKSTITDPKELKVITEIYADVAKGFKNGTLDDLDTLKQRTYNRFNPVAEKSRANAIIRDVTNTIKRKIVGSDKNYARMVSNYERASEEINDITKTLALGDKTMKMTAVTRLSQVLKDNVSLRQSMMEMLQTLSGNKDLIPKIAGLSMSKVSPSGLAGVGVGAVSVANAFNPAYWPSLLGALAVSSPRVVGEFAVAIGKPKQWLDGIIKAVAPAIEKAMPKATESLKGAGKTFGETAAGASIPAKASTVIPRSFVGGEEETGSGYESIINAR